MRRWGGDRLAIRQVRYTLAIACVLGVAFSLLHLLQDYVQERRHIERAGQGVLALIGPPAARAAFTLDPEFAATVVRSALQLQFVARAEIVDNLGRSLAEGSRVRETRNLRWLTDRLFGPHLSYRLVFDREGGALGDPEFAARSLGTLVIEFDTRILGQDFLSRSWLLLASGIAWTIILGLVLAVVTHLMITRPLVRLVGAVEQMDPASPAKLVVQVGPSHERDELGRLSRALDALLIRFAGALIQQREDFDRLAASEARYRAVVDTQGEFIVRIKPDGRLCFVNDAYCRYYGRNRDELLGSR